MSILSKIKKLFQQEEKEPEQDIKLELSSIDSWLNQNNEETEKIFKEKITSFQTELSEILSRLEQDIENLSRVDISDKRTDERIKQFTELGKKDYIFHAQQLLKKIKSKEEYEPDQINSLIQDFAKQSAKSHFKATQLIGKEVENVTNSITMLKTLERDFLKQNQELLKKRNKIKLLLKKNTERKNYEKTNLNLQQRIKNTEEELRENEKKLKQTEEALQKLKQSQQYKEKEKLLAEKNNLLQALQKTEFEVKTLLDRKILEKYAHEENDEIKKKIIEQYLQDTLKVVLSDDELKILSLLPDIKQKIENNSLVVKQPAKVIEKLNIEREVFLNYKKALLEFTKKLQEIEEKIGEVKINLDELTAEKSRIENKISENKIHIESLRKKHDKIDKIIDELNLELTSFNI